MNIKKISVPVIVACATVFCTLFSHAGSFPFMQEITHEGCYSAIEVSRMPGNWPTGDGETPYVQLKKDQQITVEYGTEMTSSGGCSAPFNAYCCFRVEKVGKDWKVTGITFTSL